MIAPLHLLSALLLPVAAVVLTVFIMLIGACVDQYYRANANRKALSYAGAGVLFGLLICTAGVAAGRWIAAGML